MTGTFNTRIRLAILVSVLAAVVVAAVPATVSSQDRNQGAPPPSRNPRFAPSTTAAEPAASADDNASAAEAAAVIGDATIPTRSLFDILLKGGLLMIPILGSSVLLLVFVFERTISLRSGRVIPRPFVKRLMHQVGEGELDRDAALELCLENKSPVALVFAHAVRKWGRPAVEVEQAIMDGGERIVNDLRRHLRVINGISTVSPLMGLLGTVTGMIRAFNSIALSQAMGRAELLAGGISEALLTTAAGLSVAIPALIFYMYFVGRVDALIVEIDALGQDLVHLISAEAGMKPATKTRTPRQEAA